MAHTELTSQLRKMVLSGRRPELDEAELLVREAFGIVADPLTGCLLVGNFLQNLSELRDAAIRGRDCASSRAEILAVLDDLDATALPHRLLN